MLKNFALRKDLPEAIGDVLVEAVWTRSVLLGDFSTADEMIDLLTVTPETKDLWLRYKNAKNGREKEIAAMLFLLNTPDFHPYIDSGHTYSYSHSWWCELGGGENSDYWKGQLPAPLFLTEEEKTQAENEQAQLAELSNGTDYLAPFLLFGEEDISPSSRINVGRA